MPPPVLIFDLAALAGVVDDVPDDIYDLGGRFWPGALTIILHSYPSLSWDLGETCGTVAVRVPDDEFALKLLTEHGPLAVSSANKTGQEAALDAQTALESLGEDVAVVIDGGARPKPLESEPNEDGVVVVTEREPAPSTILDCTSFPYVVVRALDEQADLDEAYEQWDSTHTVSGEPARRASAPAAGSVAASLMGATSALSSAFSTSVDQERSRGYRDNTPKPVRADEPQTHPVPADTARALVFGESKIETAAKSTPAQSEAKSAETKTEAAKTEAATTESEVKTEQKDMPENQL